MLCKFKAGSNWGGIYACKSRTCKWGETQFVLDYFGAEEPQLVEDVRTQVRDIEIRKTKGVADNISFKESMEHYAGE